MPSYEVEDKTAWRSWVTPKALRATPIHRWFVFPHSYAAELVHEVIGAWGLGPSDRILDPFVGAGTTLLAAKEKRIPATGYDLLPLAVMASRVKVADYDAGSLTDGRNRLREMVRAWSAPIQLSKDYPALVRKALPDDVLAGFDWIGKAIHRAADSETNEEFYRLALLAIMPEFSRAVATGGWLKVVLPRKNLADLAKCFLDRVDLMISDVGGASLPSGPSWCGREADARALPEPDSSFSAVLTSPPYPNRHDYTRVFGVELMFGFLDWEGTRSIRYQSVQSHPEAHPARQCFDGYEEPPRLRTAIGEISAADGDPRVQRMLAGYFVDMFLCLREISRVCRPRSIIGLVVGNAQYSGIKVVVDELVAEIGEQVGLKCDRILAVRYRGNSAQQMALYGRAPARESIVVFTKPVSPSDHLSR